MPRSPRSLVLPLVLMSTFMGAEASTAVARATATTTTTVSGRILAGQGLTIVGLAPNGSAVRQKLTSTGRFTLKLKTGRDATLQLLRKDGSYFGPVLLSTRGRIAYAALSGRSGRLGDIALRVGYAQARKDAPAVALDAARRVKLDSKGRPLGARRHGFVRTSTTRSAGGRAAQTGSGAAPQAGADGDRDGIPTALDLDANGNGQLDNFDASARPGNAGFFSTLFTDMRTGLNVNAGTSVDQAAIDRLISGENIFGLIFFFSDGQVRGRTITGVHVDCGALVYCRRGDGTAVVNSLADAAGSLPTGDLWTTYSPDGSGFPNLAHVPSGGGAWAMPITPHATSAQIRPGDTYDVVFNTSAGPVHVPTALSAYFVTIPAIATWASGGAPQAISYPVTDATPGTSNGNPFVLAGGQLSLTIWRPQRQAVPEAESGTFIDQGRLHYGVVLASPDGTREFGCAGHYSGLSETLSARAASAADPATQLTPLLDSAADAPPDPARTLGFTVDLAACLRAQGIEPSGSTVQVTLTAASESRPGGMDRAAQSFAVRFP